MRNTSDRNIAIGTFDSPEKADAAVIALQAAGFDYSDIGVVSQRTTEWDDYSTGRGTIRENDQEAENAASGAAAGAAAGAGIGGLWALGIAGGLLPALGPVIAGGILANILASAAAGAAAGGVGGALMGLGLSDEEAKFYDAEVNSGRTVVTVRAGARYDSAIQLLRDHGARLAATGTPTTARV